MDTFDSIFIEREDWPEWYHLGFEPSAEGRNPKLVISIVREALERYIDANRAEVCSADGFDSDYFGFAGSFRAESSLEDPRLVAYHVPISTLEKVEDDECPYCDNPGYENWCAGCGGTGHRVTIEWKRLDPMLALLSALRPLLSTPLKSWVTGLPEKRRQLVSVSIGATGSSGRGGYVGGSLSRGLSDHLRGWSPRDMPAVRDAMQATYLALFPSYQRFGGSSFRAVVCNRGQLILDVPGDACGLFVDGMHDGLRNGITPFELTCHNVDHNGQVITLLAGLAALSEEARRELNK